MFEIAGETVAKNSPKPLLRLFPQIPNPNWDLPNIIINFLPHLPIKNVNGHLFHIPHLRQKLSLFYQLRHLGERSFGIA